MKKDIKDTLMEKAAASGFDINKLIFVDHSESPNRVAGGAVTK